LNGSPRENIEKILAKKRRFIKRKDKGYPMGVKIKLLEEAKVYDINNLKATPILELASGTELEVENVMKAWKAWYKVTLSDGRIGLISTLTKAQSLGYISPKAGGWSNFVKVLASGNPDRYGYNMAECIQEYEREIIKHIQTDKNPEAVILGCESAGEDGFLQEEVINNNVIEHLAKNALKPSLASIQILVKIERLQKRHLLNDGIIKLLIEKARKSDALWMDPHVSFLVDIALLRQSSQLVDEIIEIYRTSKYQYFEFGGFRDLHRITKDDKIVDFLITQLDRGFRVLDKHAQANNLSDLFLSTDRWGPAYYAAEELLTIADPRGISEIVPHILAFVAGEHIDNIRSYLQGGGGGHLGNPELREWVVEHGQIFFPYLIEGLNYKNAEARCFAINCVMNIGYPEGIEAIKSLRNDPDKKVKKYVEDVLVY
jgi:hypothetical protein